MMATHMMPAQVLSTASSTTRYSLSKTSPKADGVPQATNFHSVADLISPCKPCQQLSSRISSPDHHHRDPDDDYIDVEGAPNDQSESEDNIIKCSPSLNITSTSQDSPVESNSTSSTTTTSSNIDNPTESTSNVPTYTRTATNSPSPCSSPTDLSSKSSASTEDPDLNRARKGRTIYKAQQVYVLEQVFGRTHYPDPEVIETLARDLDITENKIKVWFQNKRARWRRRAAESGHPGAPLPVAHPAALGWPLTGTMTPPGHPLMIPQPLYPLPAGIPIPNPMSHPFFFPPPYNALSLYTAAANSSALKTAHLPEFHLDKFHQASHLPSSWPESNGKLNI